MISSSIGPCDQLLDLLSYKNFDLSMGYRQIKSEPTMFVMLSYSWLSLEPTPLYLLVWPILSPCSHNGGIPVIWKFWWVVVEPISSILSPPWFMLNIKLLLETSISIIFMFRAWSICFDERSDFLWFTCIDVSCRREFEKVCFCSSGIIPSQSCIRAKYSVVWRLATFILYVFLAHQATDWFVQGEEVPS